MAERDAAIPPTGANRDSPEFVAFMRAEREVGDFLARHDHELAVLREPIAGITTDRYWERLARLDTELGWLEARTAEAGHTGPVHEAYSAAWVDRQADPRNPPCRAGRLAPRASRSTWRDPRRRDRRRHLGSDATPGVGVQIYLSCRVSAFRLTSRVA